jgi:hypothetical protein
MALTITDNIMHSDVTSHTAELHRFEADDTWRVSLLPQRLMDRAAAITAMTLAELARAGDGIGLHDDYPDPRWPEVDALAAELGLSGPDAVVMAWEHRESRSRFRDPPPLLRFLRPTMPTRWPRPEGCRLYLAHGVITIALG